MHLTTQPRPDDRVAAAPEVTVRAVRYGDGPELIAANLASRDHHAPWAQPFTNSAGFETWFGQSLTGANRAFVARRDDSGAVAGVITLDQIVWGVFRSAYLGYYGMVAHARSGCMTVALREVIRIAFTELGLHRLEANIQPGNAASLALIRRLGFRYEGFSPRYLQIGGTWRDHERWALLSDQAADRD